MKKIKETLICSALAVVIGVQMGFISGLFGRILELIEQYRSAHYLLFVPLLGAAGVLVLFVYKRFSPSSEQGLNLAIAYNMGEVGDDGRVHDFGKAHKIGKYPNAYVLLKLFSNAVMLMFGASTGKEGTIAACGAAIGDYTSRIFKSREYSRTLLITGVSAAIAGLFGTPLGGTFFALEFSAAGILFYQALVPAFIGAYTSYYISGVCGLKPFSHIIAPELGTDLKSLLLFVLCAVTAGLVGRLFVLALSAAKGLYGKYVKNRYIGILTVGSAAALFMILIYQGRYCGTGSALLEGLFETGEHYVYDFILKFAFTVICITIGFTGGEMMPLMCIGALMGAAMSQITGMPYDLTVVMCCMAVYSSATNTLLAPMFIGAEIFGAQSVFYIAAACIIAFAVNGNHSVYGKQANVMRSIYGVLKK